MKKAILLCSALVAFQLVNAQSFYKHAVVVSADYGLEFYSLTQQYSLQDLGKSETATGNTSNSNFNFSVEYGLSGWLGIGLQGKIDHYNFDKDSSGYAPTAASGEVGALLNIHIIHIDKIDLMAGTGIGFSTISYTGTEDKVNYKYSGNSLWTDAHVTFRYYFGRIGLNASAYIPFTNYKDMTSSTNWQTGQAVLNNWKNTGGGFNIGIQFRLIGLPK